MRFAEVVEGANQRQTGTSAQGAHSAMLKVSERPVPRETTRGLSDNTGALCGCHTHIRRLGVSGRAEGVHGERHSGGGE